MKSKIIIIIGILIILFGVVLSINTSINKKNEKDNSIKSISWTIKSHSVSDKTLITFPVFNDLKASSDNGEYNSSFSSEDDKIIVNAYTSDSDNGRENFLNDIIKEFENNKGIKYFTKEKLDFKQSDVSGYRIKYRIEEETIDDNTIIELEEPIEVDRIIIAVDMSKNETGIIEYIYYDNTIDDNCIDIIKNSIQVTKNAKYNVGIIEDGIIKVTLKKIYEGNNLYTVTLLLDNKLYEEIEDSKNSNEYVKLGKKDSDGVVEIYYYYSHSDFDNINSLANLKEYINIVYELDTSIENRVTINEKDYLYYVNDDLSKKVYAYQMDDRCYLIYAFENWDDAINDMFIVDLAVNYIN